MNRLAHPIARQRPPSNGARRGNGVLRSRDEVQHVVLDGVSWGLYERLLREVGDGPLRMTFDQGRLEMMSPLPWHERAKNLIHDLVRELTLIRDMPCVCLGSTTFRREELGRGAEPDDCYYFKHAAKMRGRKRLRRGDPPPELVVEIDLTHRSIDREPIYAALGVPEIWRYDGKRVVCLVLSGGSYAARKKSLAFGFLTVGELVKFVRMMPRCDDNEIVRRFRKWFTGKER